MKIRMFWTPPFLSWFFPERKWSCPSNDSVFLTFDDGPHPEITPWLINFAKEQDIKLNFFWLGKNTVEFPALLSLAVENGHLVANHGYEHWNALKVNRSKYLNNVEKGQEQVPYQLFRPPYGRLSWRQALKIKQKSTIIMWSFLSYDWDKNVSNADILKALQKKLKPGSILVFHESEKTKDRYKELIPNVVKVIKKRGLKIDLLPLSGRS